MWLPAFKYIKGLFALRGQFTFGNGAPYEGAYHKLYNGETYTGAVPSTESVRIFFDDSEPALPDITYDNLLVSEPIYPQPEEYTKGFFTRYFVKDSRNGKIVEVKKETYSKKLKEKYLKGTTIKWILEKPVRDIFNQGFLYKGAATRNKENTQKANLELKGLDLFVTEFDKYVDIESDVEGYRFEDLSREEKLRIIKRTSNIQKKKPKEKIKRFKKIKPIKRSVRPEPRTTAPVLSTAPRRTGSGGGGGGGYSNNDEGIFDEGNRGGGFGGGGNVGGSSTMNQY